MLFYPNPDLKITESTVLISEKERNSHIKTTRAFCAPALYLDGNEKLEEEKSKYF